MALAAVTLDDKYVLDRGRVYLTGTQALVRLPMLQRQRDAAAGLNTGCFISGYRGSPLGGLDQALWGARRFIEKNHIRFQPAINEELGATAIWGSQQLGLFPGAQYDGVFAMWYAKGPGVDRSGDALKHGNAAGSAPHGGVLLLAGDDHTCKSSTLPHQSEYAFIDACIPVLNPSGVQEILDLGLYGWAMSRYSGCWIALQDGRRDRGQLGLGRARRRSGSTSSCPPISRCRRAGSTSAGPTSRSTRNTGCTNTSSTPPLPSPAPTGSTVSSSTARSRASASSPPANPISMCARRSTISGSTRRTPPRSAFACTRSRCRGRSKARASAISPRASKKSSSSKKSAASSKPSSRSSSTTGRADGRPHVIGKFDENGDWILPSTGELTPAQIARVIARRIARFQASPRIAERLALLEARERQLGSNVVPFARTPYFCSGCPHNSSTKVPDGSRALAGIGCHYLAQFMDRSTATFTQMGGEGAPWIGQAPFTETRHVFANLGDGTYTHSGVLAIRAAVAAKVNITYKLLFNDAVAMTGGQPIDGGLTVPVLTRQLAAGGRRAYRRRHRRARQISARDRFCAGRDGAPSRRPRCRPARIARDAGRHRDRLRPDLRRRKAPPPQTRPFPGSGQTGLYQRSGLRGLRRLLEDVELRFGGAGRNRIRAQAGDRPIELQQGLFLRRGFLPELCHRPWRRPQKAPGRRPRRGRAAGACPSLRSRLSTNPTASSSPASAAPASSRSGHCSAWRRISKARAARFST